MGKCMDLSGPQVPYLGVRGGLAEGLKWYPAHGKHCTGAWLAAAQPSCLAWGAAASGLQEGPPGPVLRASLSRLTWPHGPRGGMGGRRLVILHVSKENNAAGFASRVLTVGLPRVTPPEQALGRPAPPGRSQGATGRRRERAPPQAAPVPTRARREKLVEQRGGRVSVRVSSPPCRRPRQAGPGVCSGEFRVTASRGGDTGQPGTVGTGHEGSLPGLWDAEVGWLGALSGRRPLASAC